MKRISLFVTLLSLNSCGAVDPTTSGEVDLDHLDSPIIGGTLDTGDPSVVAIFAHAPNASSGSVCTGSVISPHVVLTAAHCVDPRLVGSNVVFDVYRGTTLNAANRMAVASTAFDPAFNPQDLRQGHDVAVVILAQPTTLKPLVLNRATIPTTAQGSAVRIVGYGANTHSNTGAGTKRSVSTTIGGVSSQFLLIGGSNQQTCHGDSGGPAFQTIAGVEKVVGLTSFGMDRSSTQVCFGGGYHTRVDASLAFIDSYL